MGLLLAALEPFGQAEIRHMRLSLFVHQNVCRLQVAVQDAALMRVMHRLGHDGHEPGRRPRLGRVMLHPSVKTGSTYQLHAEKVLPAALADLVNRHDVRVIELGDRLRFVLKSDQLGFRREATRFYDLERDRPIERELLGFEHDPHSPAPQLAQDFVARFFEPFRSVDDQPELLIPVRLRLSTRFNG